MTTEATNETRHFALSGVEIRAKTDDHAGQATGYAAVFNSDSHDLGGFVERIAPGAFARSLKEAAAGDANVFALWAHRDDQPLGSTSSGKLVLSEDEHGLAFSLDTTRMNALQFDALRDGDLRMSFGFRVREDNWRELNDGTIERTLIEVDLFEISFVISPAYPATEAAMRSLESWRAAKVEMKVEIENPEAVNDNLRIELMKRTLTRRLIK
ncbi:HK97 family phage prohead protease [Novosphingobium sp.]|jgi:HK97 family phage prohead protease|uniref:HK97 family phage prohead protease n=1 Tax=Novosphingobium sp. TaxID=1874826 RepID=UPI002FE0E079